MVKFTNDKKLKVFVPVRIKLLKDLPKIKSGNFVEMYLYPDKNINIEHNNIIYLNVKDIDFIEGVDFELI